MYTFHVALEGRHRTFLKKLARAFDRSEAWALRKLLDEVMEAREKLEIEAIEKGDL